LEVESNNGIKVSDLKQDEVQLESPLKFEERKSSKVSSLLFNLLQSDTQPRAKKDNYMISRSTIFNELSKKAFPSGDTNKCKSASYMTGRHQQGKSI
jgi:hypothetical protein